MHPVNHPAAEPETIRLGVAGRAVRALVLVAVCVGVVVDTWQRNDQGWPFAPMSQFAYGTKATNGVINSRYIEATTVTGERVRLDLRRGGIGLQRAEIDVQIWNFTQQPSLLQAIAVLHARRLPDAARLARIDIMNDRRILKDGVVGPVETRTEVSWQVISPQAPQEIP